MSIVSVELHHGGISVKNLDQSILFYQENFGFCLDSKTKIHDGFKIAFLKLGDRYLELFWFKDSIEAPEHTQNVDQDLQVIGVKHIAFHASDIEQCYSTLKENGVEIISEVRYGEAGYGYFFYKDCNGIIGEIVSAI